MASNRWLALLAFTVLDFASATRRVPQPTRPPATVWTTEFGVAKTALSAHGRNRYFVLEPGHTATYEGGGERLIITVLPDTLRVDGVQTAVVEEREWKNGALIEVSRNYFAINPRDSAIYYFGEDVDMYRDGRVVNHDGSWRSGVGGARFGLMMPGVPRVGARFHQEVAPKVAMDRAEIVSATVAMRTPAGAYTSCVRIEETSPLEVGAKEYKTYCPGIGLVADGDLKLVALATKR